MNRSLFFMLAGLWLVLAASANGAEEIQLVADRDATLYESSSGALANGAGTFLYSGTTGQFSNGKRRLLLHFDLSSIPTNAVLMDAELSLSVSKGATSDSTDYGLHRVLSDWGEGDSDASELGQGQGTAAAEGDATWLHTFSPNGTWTTPGGDFEEEPSAVTAIRFANDYAWSSEQLLDDVQVWFDQPTDNFGWILVGNEAETRTSRQFSSRSNPVIESRPTLTVSYVIGLGLPTDCNGDGVVDLLDLDCACSDTNVDIDEVLNELGLIKGDLDGDGEVGFPDFLTLSNGYGQPGTYSGGDIDSDGSVGFSDFLLLSGAYGQTSVASGALSTVPEPNGGLAMSIGGLLFVLGFRKFR